MRTDFSLFFFFPFLKRKPWGSCDSLDKETSFSTGDVGIQKPSDLWLPARRSTGHWPMSLPSVPLENYRLNAVSLNGIGISVNTRFKVSWRACNWFSSLCVHACVCVWKIFLFSFDFIIQKAKFKCRPKKNWNGKTFQDLLSLIKSLIYLKHK